MDTILADSHLLRQVTQPAILISFERPSLTRSSYHSVIEQAKDYCPYFIQLLHQRYPPVREKIWQRLSNDLSLVGRLDLPTSDLYCLALHEIRYYYNLRHAPHSQLQGESIYRETGEQIVLGYSRGLSERQYIYQVIHQGQLYCVKWDGGSRRRLLTTSC